jgi:hypothetical protein
MQSISTDLQFAAILDADRAIVFIGVDWSLQSRLSAAVIEEWERKTRAWGFGCPVHIVNPELHSLGDWMKDHSRQLKGEGGYGSLIWLQSGTIVDYEPYVAGAGLREISRRTRAAFLPKKPNPSLLAMWDRELDG